ncbi:MAG: hypothetical protein A2283_03565 [Lentisphaerae bacterium RIFOXYA12_FULL_48_11]|nr:MAG: hypothetical protein A2283_03565 [Lentisphaerae bacterium RIFOXYA12_FULL_48_11]
MRKARIVLTIILPLAVLAQEKTSIASENKTEFSEKMNAYHALWNAPEIAKRINDGIENNRKGDANIVVMDANGHPVKGVSLDIQQQKHAFLFGCNAFVLGQLESPERNRQYEETFTRIFNFATVPIYWKGTEPKQGALRYKEGCDDIWRRPPVDRFIPFARKYGLTLKAHPMLWHEHNPEWLPKDPEALKGLYRKRFKELADHYAKDITIWEVTNESSGCHKTYPLYSEDRAYVAWAFREVAPLFGDKNLLMINDFTCFNERLPADKTFYYKQISGLLKEGLRIQGIGLQFHLWFEPRLMEKHLSGERFQPERMIEAYKILSALGRPLYITEITVPTPADKDGEEMQAEVVKNLYRLWFSTPAMAGITYWNLGDSMAHDKENTAAAGLIDKDLKPKVSYRILDELINRDWKTRLILKTDDQGTTHFRGFQGTYTVRVKLADKEQVFEINLDKSTTTPNTLKLKPD